MTAAKGDDGAVAAMTAVLAIVLIAVAAFAVDFGAAYVNKRQLSTGADAAAIAAARYYAAQPGSCSTLAASKSAFTAANNAGSPYINRNSDGTPDQVMTVACGPGNKTLWVSYDDARATKTSLGSAIGVNNVYANSEATAEVFVPLQGSGAAPYAICYSDVLAMQADPTNIQKVVFPGACGNPGGNWYTIDCPEDVAKSAAQNIDKLCTTPITVITTNPPHTDTGPPVPGTTEFQLLTTCLGQPAWATPGSNPGCLRGNTGNIGSAADTAFWNQLVGTTVLLPVIYKNTISGTGSLTRFPVAGFVGVTVCGFHWGNSSKGQTTASPCDSSHNAHGYTSNDPPSNSNYLLLLYGTYVSDGVVGPDPNCGLGGLGGPGPSCDMGNRNVRLIH